MSDYGLVVVGAFFPVAGLGSALSALGTYRETRALKCGVVVSGKIISAAIEEQTIPDGDRDNYRPIIRYRYTVRDQEYESTQLARDPSQYDWSIDKGLAHRIVDKYRVGKEVQVYCDPLNPAVSALELTEATYTATLLQVIFGLGLVLLGAFMGLVGIWKPSE